MSFNNLQLDPKLLQALEACGFSAPTDIQSAAIPVALAGRDLMASAQTGTGKTAAFVLPTLQRLLTPSAVNGVGPRVLILTPTRELAQQIGQNIAQLGKFCRFSTGDVVGGMPYGPQMRLLRQPLDMLVATPGRLMDHMESGRIDFSRLEVLVLDEADRMLDMGFVDAVKDIARKTPATRQTLLFSATLEGRVLAIARDLLRDPERIQLADNHQQNLSIVQKVHRADDVTHKHAMLKHYLASTELTQAIVFASTKRSADKLAQTLADQGHQSAALHGDMNQAARKRTVERMQRGVVRVLVATDVAARGIDIRGVTHVINFDLPMVAEDYIHRIGRTGRGGDSGTAISFIGPDDQRKLQGIERLIGRKLEREDIVGLEPKRAEYLGAGKPRSAPRGYARHGQAERSGGRYSSPRPAGSPGPAGATHHAGPRKPWADRPASGQRRFSNGE